MIMTENQKRLGELLFCIQLNNEKAREAKSKNEGDAQKYHNACKNALIEVINGDYGNISRTYKVMFDKGTGIGCQECNDTCSYSKAIREYDIKTKEEIEKKYGIQLGCESCSSCRMVL